MLTSPFLGISPSGQGRGGGHRVTSTSSGRRTSSAWRLTNLMVRIVSLEIDRHKRGQFEALFEQFANLAQNLGVVTSSRPQRQNIFAVAN